MEEREQKSALCHTGGSYVALDLETTGLDPKRDKIIEIGACRVRDGEIEEELSLLINPHQLLPERITALTGITDGMVQEAPDMEAVVGQVMEFCRDLPILGHHVIFDYSFLKRAAVNAGFPFERSGIDTLSLCRRFMPAEEKKNLAAACAWYKVLQETAHRALSDARMAHFLYQKMREQSFLGNEELFAEKPLIYKVKRDQPASKKQKEDLRELAKYHRIHLSVDIEYLTRSEVSRMTDKIIFQYGRMKKR